MVKKIISILIIFGILLPNFSFGQEKNFSQKILEKFLEKLKDFWQFLITNVPLTLKEAWKEKVFPIWKKMWEWFKENVWLKIKETFSEEVKEKKPVIKEEFEKEKEELKSESLKFWQFLWKKLKELIKQ